MAVITLGGRRIEYMVVKGRGSRHAYFRFGPDTTLEVVAPRRPSFDVVKAILQEREWILKQHADLARKEHVLQTGSVLFGGKRLKLDFQRTEGSESLDHEAGSARVTVRSSDAKRIKELVRRWFLKESSSYVVKTLPGLAANLHVNYRKADVREIRNWGYCTRDGRLSFSWQLIALPEKLRDYILYHELVHILEHNHGPGFKQRLSSVLPDFRDRERELNRVVPYVGRPGT